MKIDRTDIICGVSIAAMCVSIVALINYEINRFPKPTPAIDPLKGWEDCIAQAQESQRLAYAFAKIAEDYKFKCEVKEKIINKYETILNSNTNGSLYFHTP